MDCRLRIVTITAALFAAGCATEPAQDTAEIAEAALPDNAVVPEGFATASNAALQAVRSGWLADFAREAPEVEELVREALENNLNLVAAAARVDSAAGVAIQAGAELKPAVALGASANSKEGFSAATPGLTTSGAALNVSWELDLWGRVRSQAAAGQAAFEAAEFQYLWAYQSLAANTVKVWLLLNEANQQLAVAEESLALARRTEELVSSKLRQGQVTSRELSRARGRTASLQASLRRIRAARDQAARSLELILGRYPSASIVGSAAFPAVPAPPPVGVPSELLERRPDLMAAERAVAARFFSVQTAEAARLPRIALTGAVGTQSAELTDIIALDSQFWSVGANFMAPLFTGGALEAQVDINEAAYAEALAGYGMLALRAFSEVEQSLANERYFRESAVYQQKAIDAESEALRVTDAQFNVGRVDLLSVLQQQVQLLAARSGLISTHGAALQERINLYLALGGGFEGPIDATP